MRKRLSRSLVVSWREQPTRQDVEALRANIQRVGLVIRTRWTLIVVLVIYSLAGGAMYLSEMPVGELARLMVVPAGTLGLVVLYNTYYSLNYRRFGNLRYWNNVQLGLDTLVIAILVYFSGGVSSWFWSLFALFILEATLILPDSRDAWMHALYTCFILGVIEWSEYFGLLPHVRIPFSDPSLATEFTFVAVRYSWQVAVLMGTAWVSTVIIGEFRLELRNRQLHTLIDEATGVYSRSYFMKACAAEGKRARRAGRAFHVFLIDVDHFGQFNARFGIDAGDRMLRELAQLISEAVGITEDEATGNVVARFGGEEFAVLLAEEDGDGYVSGAESADDVARRIVEAVRDLRVDDAGITISLGVATMPDDGETCEQLLDVADSALSQAIEEGGDRVIRFAATAGTDAADSPSDG